MAAKVNGGGVNGFKVSGQATNSSLKEMDLSVDLHVKMSKKIAQLTKVIYALNTKNDEHETTVACIREQHEERVQQILAETRTKVEYYRKKVLELSEVVKHSSSSKEMNGKLSEEHLAELELLRKSNKEKDTRLRNELDKITSLTETVGRFKVELESKIRRVDELENQYSIEKQNAISDLQAKHQRQLEMMKQSLNSQERNLSSLKQELEDKHRAELNDIHERLSTVEIEKRNLEKEFEEKFAKTQAFHEKELEVIRNSQNATSDERYKLLSERFDKLKSEMTFQDKTAKQRINDLLNQISVGEESLEKVSQDNTQLKGSLDELQTKQENLLCQLEDAKSELSQSKQHLLQLEAELVLTKTTVEQQSKDLFNKSSSIGELEASRLQHLSTIKDLTDQQCELKDRISSLENARNLLESSNSSMLEEQQLKIKSLEKALEEISNLKEQMKENHSRELKELELNWKQTKENLVEDHRLEVNSINSQHLLEWTEERKQVEAKLVQLKQELEAHMRAECAKLTKEKQSLEEQLKKLKLEYEQQLENAKKEIERLEALVRDSQSGLGTAGKHVESLRRATDDLKKELECTKVLLNMATDKSESLQRECDNLKEEHEQSLKEAEQKLITTTDQLRIDLEKTWTQKLSTECENVRKKVQEQSEVDKQLAVDQTIQMKNTELAAVRQGWEKKMSQLLDEISTLKKDLEAVERNASETTNKLRKESDDENRRLRMELSLLSEEHQRKIDNLLREHTDHISALTKEHERQIQELERGVKQKSMDELKAQLVAHKATVSSLRDELEREKSNEVERVLLQSQQDMVGLREEMEQRFAMEVETLNRSHSEELEAARMELNRALELSRLKDGEHSMAVAELEETIRHKLRITNGLQEEVSGLKNTLGQMSKDLEFKAEEIVRIRNEANQTLKSREDHLKKKHKQALTEQQTTHLEQTEDLMAEFTQAQNILKDKISQLQQMLEDAEDKYLNREPRKEDIDLIEQLKKTIQEKDEETKRLYNDRRFYQMELVNREMNFNKMFNADPKVGLLNPLAVGKKMKGKEVQHRESVHRFSSSSSNSSNTNNNRLPSLPGSPLHEEKINTFRPLPPTKKVFLE